MRKWDVLVVGGGPAGAAAARAAVLEGASVLLLERDLRPREKVCGEYLCPGAVERLHALGFAAALGSDTAPLLGMRLFSPKGREVRTGFPSGRPGLSVRREVLDPRLVELSQARVLRGRRVERVTVHEGEARVIADGEVFEARAVVGADGRHSTVAAQASLHLPHRGRARATLHAYYENVRGVERAGEMHLPGTGAYAGLNPGASGLVNVSYVCDLESLGPKPMPRAGELLDEALANIPSLAPRFAAARRTGPVRILAPLEVRARRVQEGPILLAGDASGFLDPLTGEGMFGAIVTGERAGRRAAALALGRRAPARDRREGGKRHLNRVFQWLLKKPALLEALGRRFAARPQLGDTLMAVIGNLERPKAILRALVA